MEYFIEERFTKISVYFSEILSFNESHIIHRDFSRYILYGFNKYFLQQAIAILEKIL